MKTTVRKIDDPNLGPLWQVRHACGCPTTRRRAHWVALILATRHQCPREGR